MSVKPFRVVFGLLGMKTGRGWSECSICHRKACSGWDNTFGRKCSECIELKNSARRGDFKRVAHIEAVIAIETEEDFIKLKEETMNTNRIRN
jgi:hypothetical protein